MRPEPFPRLVLTGQSQEDVLIPPSPLATDGRNEAWLRDFLMRHPSSLPCAEIDSAFADAIPVCTELRTAAGPIDGLLVTRAGRLVILECKLWRNPQARREVVGQILDYAKELARWDYADLQAAVSARIGKGDNPLFRRASSHFPELDEARFVDGVQRTLTTGRFLLLIAGDGIQSSASAIAEYLQEHATLRFSLGMVEVRGYALPDGRMLVQPRILARTEIIERLVVIPIAQTVGSVSSAEEAEAQVDEAATDLSSAAEKDARVLAEQVFWEQVSAQIRFDDPAQPIPRQHGPFNARAKLFIPELRVTLIRSRGWDEVGASIAFVRDLGRRIYDLVKLEAADIDEEFKKRMPEGTLVWVDWVESKKSSMVTVRWKNAFTSGLEDQHKAWLCRACAALVDTLRPRIRVVLDTMDEKMG
jgi:hypothetical protein